MWKKTVRIKSGWKILRSLLERFQPKMITIEESEHVDKLKLDELVGNLQTYKANHLTKKNSESIAFNNKLENIDIDIDSKIDHEVVANFVKRY